MFRIGLPEILIILAVVVIFVNPKELPGFFRKFGKGVQQIKRMRDEFTRSVKEMQDDLGLTNPVGRSSDRGASRTAASGPTGDTDARPATWNEGGGI